MSTNLEQHYMITFSDRVALKLQTMGGRLRQYCTPGTYSGEAASVVDQYDQIEPTEVTGRFKPMGRQDFEVDRPWIYPRDWEAPVMFDSIDKMRIATQPESPAAMNMAKGFKRLEDKAVLDAVFGVMRHGKQGADSEAFDATNLAVPNTLGSEDGSTATGLNFRKILRGKRFLMESHVDLSVETAVMAISAIQNEDLMADEKITSKDFFQRNGQPIYNSNGLIDTWCGVKFVHTELVRNDGTDFLNPMWVPSGMHFGEWKPYSTRMDPRPDLSGVPYQLYGCATFSATRIEQGRVVQIKNVIPS